MAFTEDPHEALRRVSYHDPDMLEGLLATRLETMEASGLDARTYSLVNIAALIAAKAPPSSYVWQIGMALESGVSLDDVLGALVATNPVVGNVRSVAAAPNVVLAVETLMEEE
jgi:4-carboxymuconolactone decarboxylase